VIKATVGYAARGKQSLLLPRRGLPRPLSLGERVVVEDPRGTQFEAKVRAVSAAGAELQVTWGPASISMGFDPQDIADMVAKSCAAQGFAVKVTDPLTLHNVAVLLSAPR
jgi:hypothetical protein